MPALCEFVVNSMLHEVKNNSFRRILKSHMVRCKKQGGPICSQHVKDSIVQSVDAVNQTVTLTLSFPSSFEPNDGAACSATAMGQSSSFNPAELIEEACKNLLLELLIADGVQNRPNSKMFLKSTNWRISIQELLGAVSQHLQGLGVRTTNNSLLFESCACPGIVLYKASKGDGLL